MTDRRGSNTKIFLLLSISLLLLIGSQHVESSNTNDVTLGTFNVTCGFETQFELNCEQQIYFQYNDTLCLQPCLSCKINNSPNCSHMTCCNNASIERCNFQSSCSNVINNGCETTLIVNRIYADVFGVSIFYENRTYDTNITNNIIIDNTLVDCPDPVISSSSIITQPTMIISSSAITEPATTSDGATSTSSATSSTPSPSPTQSSTIPTAAYIAIGGLAVFAVLCIAIFVFIAIVCFLKQRKKRHNSYEMRNRATSHTYVTSQPYRISTKQQSSTNFDVPSTQSREDMEFRSRSFSPAVAVFDEPGPFREHLASDVTSNRPALPPDPLSLNYNRWLSVFSSVIVKKENLAMSVEAIGEGAFGKVYKGEMKMKDPNGASVNKDVAVKTLKANPTTEQIEEFISESAVMLDFDHPNVLKLLGVCFDTEDQLPVIVLPFMANGDLKSFLRKNRKQPNVKYNDFPPDLNHVKLLYMCLDVAKGMEYLARKKFVHRDLAARNCIVDHGLSVYVADFGLSRDVYSRDYYRMGVKAAKLPIKWMSPESLNDGLYGEKSDVWSFGVTCWEIFSLGRSPYPAIDNAEVLDHIESGARLKKPALCEKPMYEVMLSCWTLEPEDRATFSELVGSICTLIRESSVQSDEPSNEYFTLEETLDEVIAKRKELTSAASEDVEENGKVPLAEGLGNDPIAEPYSVPVSTNHFDPDPMEGTEEGAILPYAQFLETGTAQGTTDLYEEIGSVKPYTLPNETSTNN